MIHCFISDGVNVCMYVSIQNLGLGMPTIRCSPLWFDWTVSSFTVVCVREKLALLIQGWTLNLLLR